MLSKLRRNLSREISKSLGLQNCNNISMEKVALTHRTRDNARKVNLKKFIPSHRQRRVTRRLSVDIIAHLCMSFLILGSLDPGFINI
jgi:hypothetical protein